MAARERVLEWKEGLEIAARFAPAESESSLVTAALGASRRYQRERVRAHEKFGLTHQSGDVTIAFDRSREWPATMPASRSPSGATMSRYGEFGRSRHPRRVEQRGSSRAAALACAVRGVGLSGDQRHLFGRTADKKKGVDPLAWRSQCWAASISDDARRTRASPT
jgi:hypothetical protein